MNRRTKITCPEYLEFIRAKACCVCGWPPPSDPDHLVARGSGSGKQNDLTAIPLCRTHHFDRQNLEEHIFIERHEVNPWKESAWNLIEFFLDDERRRGAIIITGKI